MYKRQPATSPTRCDTRPTSNLRRLSFFLWTRRCRESSKRWAEPHQRVNTPTRWERPGCRRRSPGAGRGAATAAPKGRRSTRGGRARPVTMDRQRSWLSRNCRRCGTDGGVACRTDGRTRGVSSWISGKALPMERDMEWDAMWEIASRLGKSSESATLVVCAARRRSLRSWRVVEGIEVVDNWTAVWEPVRWRRLLGTEWHPMESVSTAASNIGWFLRNRPDISA